jgi:hypothetical protein
MFIYANIAEKKQLEEYFRKMIINEFNEQNIQTYKPRRKGLNHLSRKPHPLKVIFWILIGLAFIAGVLIGITYFGTKVWKKNKTVECQKWQRYAKEYKGFYLRIEDIEQCKSLGIEVIK